MVTDEDAVTLASVLKTLLAREIVPSTVSGTGASTAQSVRKAKRHWLPRPPQCEHHHLQIDDLDDLYCKDCGGDFTD
jgi:hypothetical protein